MIEVILAIVPLIVACSTYTAISPTLAPTSGTVRLSMNDAGRTETLGPLGAQVTSVEGEVRSISDSAVTIVVSEVGRASSDAEQFHGEPVTIPSRYIAGIERKHVQVARSLLIAGAIVGGAIWIGTQGHGNVTFGHPAGPPRGGECC
ncbi:MAG TPA: hypothetical protein VK529_10560 [Gemmatimonadaceae bacterium]|jgi:hypothetical protein|nr:hypothetical protein [Gemmatimonadaceae bacterium]